ncbi:hypothetical protein [Microbispora triticiradicis]|uniref:hypothetical protein n=1 Tax=Microbispora triticiradicis TaxID=2200763 RepID=UPI001AD62F78|nr:hypothetical protein [Microbispora triticiradicis]MBO4273118.1 hypothetical protein [Microbispora triticiradicis]
MILKPMQHDAEWLLQRERLINELIADSKRGKKRRQDNTRIAATITCSPVAASEEAAAERVIRAVAARVGATRQDVDEALQALGLAPTEKGQPVRECPRCGNTVPIRSNRTLVSHSRVPGQPLWVSPCEGTAVAA